MRQFSARWMQVSAVALLGFVAGGCGSSNPGDLFGDGPLLDAEVDAAESDSGAFLGDTGVVPSGSLTSPVGTGVSPDTGVSPPDTGASASDGAVNDGAAPAGCSVSFVNLSPGQALELADDEDSNCANDVQVDVEVSTTLPNGAKADLSVGSGTPVRATAAAGQFVFQGVTFPRGGLATATVSVVGQAECTAAVTVEGDCLTTPTCRVQHKLSGVEKTLLNGVASPLGDRVSSDGQPYRTSFTVETNLPDDGVVLLDVDDATELLFGYANGGIATFASVDLGADGAHTLVATCTGDVETESDPLAIEVDATDPTVLANSITPIDGYHYSPQADVDSNAAGLQFDICVPVDSPDALDLNGDQEDNICVALGSQAPNCAPATSGGLTGGADGGCVRFDCPGSASFDLNVSVLDEAGNPTTHVIHGLTCASSEPLVQIVSLQDATGNENDVTKHLLAAGAANGQLQDENANIGGAQHTLIACTDAGSGTARLLGGATGAELTQRGTTVALAAAQPSDNCPVGLTSVARFPQATIPASTESPLVLTELRVEVTDPSTEVNESLPVRLWVDVESPQVSLFSPNPGTFCGSIIGSATDAAQSLRFLSSDYPRPVTANVENGGLTGVDYVFTHNTDSISVALPLGNNIIRATTTDAAGNVGTFQVQGDDCKVLVGEPPLVAWNSPTTGAILNAAGTAPGSGTLQDADSNTAGWQGDLSVTVTNIDLAGGDAAGVVQFKIEGVAVGVPIALSSGTGDNTSRTVTLAAGSYSGIPDGAAVDVSVEVTGTQEAGGATLANLLVDTVAPSGATAAVAAIGSGAGDRRRTRIHLTWGGAGDGTPATGSVAGYLAAYSTSPITDQTAFTAAFASNGLPFGGTPQTPGSTETLDVDGLTIETVYYFAVQAYDAAGNKGPVVQANAAGPDAPGLAGRFLTTVLNNPDSNNDGFGYAMDGSTDLTGDGLAELIISSIKTGVVYIYKGAAGGYSDPPIFKITGSTSLGFGYSVAVVGDIDNSAAGLPGSPSAAQLAQQQDLVITGNNGGGAYVFLGRNWETAPDAVVANNDASARIQSSDGGFFETVARVGDFNGDNLDDFAVGDISFGAGPGGSTPGSIAVILGKNGTFGNLTISSTTALGAPDALLLKGSGESWLGLAPIFALSDGSIAGAIADTVTAFPLVNAVLFPPTASAETALSSAASFAGQANSNLGNFGFGLMSGDRLFVGSPSNLGAPGDDLVDVFMGSGVSAPFTGRFTVDDGGTTTDFGRIAVGNAFSGRAAGYAQPFFGDTASVEPTLILGGESQLPPSLHFLRGATLQSMSGVVHLGSPPISDVVYELKNVAGAPVSWAGGQAVAVHDVNGDGYADLAVGESSDNPLDGHVIILY